MPEQLGRCVKIIQSIHSDKILYNISTGTNRATGLLLFPLLFRFCPRRFQTEFGSGS